MGECTSDESKLCYLDDLNIFLTSFPAVAIEQRILAIIQLVEMNWPCERNILLSERTYSSQILSISKSAFKTKTWNTRTKTQRVNKSNVELSNLENQEIKNKRNAIYRSWSMFASVNEPIFMQIVQLFQVIQANRIFFWASTCLHSFVHNFGRRSQIHCKYKGNTKPSLFEIILITLITSQLHMIAIWQSDFEYYLLNRLECGYFRWYNCTILAWYCTFHGEVYCLPSSLRRNSFCGMWCVVESSEIKKTVYSKFKNKYALTLHYKVNVPSVWFVCLCVQCAFVASSASHMFGMEMPTCGFPYTSIPK